MKATAAVVVAILAVLALLYVATAPTPPAELTAAEIAQIQSEVERAAEDWMEVWQMNDCEAGRGFWHPEYLSQPRGGTIAKTVDDLMEQCNQALANRESFSGNWTDTEVKVISRNAAIFAGNWEGTFHYRDDTPPRHYAHSATVLLFIRTETGWALSFYVNSNDSPQPVSEEG